MSLLLSFIQNGSARIKSLAMGSVQLVGSTTSAPLPGLSPKLTSLNPKLSKDSLLLTISAGLPHFSVGLWRSWGRDTFISLRGLLLVTGRFQEARYIRTCHVQNNCWQRSDTHYRVHTKPEIAKSFCLAA